MSKGFTLTELVLVVGLFLVIFSITMPIGSNWYNLNNFDSTVSTLLSDLRKAQSYSIDKKDNATWGVCITGDILRFFSGSCGSPTVKNDYSVPINVDITGLTSVTFSQLRGEPSSVQNIAISGSGKTKTIIVNLLGGFDIN